jgi:putative ABC transport system permease protein
LLVSLRRLRDERAPVAVMLVLVFVTALVFGLVPRLLEVVSDDTLRSDIAAAPAVDRNIQMTREGRILGAGQGVSRVEDSGTSLREEMPASVRDLIDGHTYVIDSARFLKIDPFVPRGTVRLRFQQGIADHVTLISGRLPEIGRREMVFPETDAAPSARAEILEAALSRRTAELLRLEVGDVTRLDIDATDRLGLGHSEEKVGIEVIGIFEPLDAADDFWLGDPDLLSPRTRLISSEEVYFDATALLGDAAYDDFLDITGDQALPLRYTWRYQVDTDRLARRGSDMLISDLRRMETLYPIPIGRAGDLGVQPVMRTALVRLLETERDRWTAVASVLTVTGVGPVVVAAAALALIALLVAMRRRPSIALQRGRGAAGGRLAIALTIESLLLTLPVALGAGWLAISLVPSSADVVTTGIAVAVALVSTFLLAAQSLPSGIGPRVDRSREASGQRRPSPRRLVFEALVVGLAIGGAILLRDRGIQGASSARELATADPFFAAIPALAGIAAGLIAVRILPWPMRLLAWLAAFRRDLVPVLGLRRVTRGAGSAAVLLVLLGIAAVAAFSSAVLVHLDRAAQTIAWHQVGAPYRIDSLGGDRLPSGLDVGALPGVEAFALADRASVPLGSRGERIELLALDVGGYLDVTRGSPAETALPAELGGAGARDPLPALIGGQEPASRDAIDVGETFRLSIAGRLRSFVAIGMIDGFPSMPLDRRFTIISLDQLRASDPDATVPVTTAFIRGPTDDAALRRAVAVESPGLVVRGAEAVADRIRTTPGTIALTRGVAAAVVVSAAYAALAVTAALALAGAARATEIAHLRTLGLRRRQVAWLAVVEHGPIVLVAAVLGILLGLALFLVLRPGLGLAAVLGSELTIPLAIEVTHVAIIILVLGGIMVLGLGLALVLGRRTDVAQAVRRGIE